MLIVVTIFLVGIFYFFQSYIFKKFWNKKLEVEVSFSNQYAIEGDEMAMNIVVVNNKVLPLPLVYIKFQVSKYLLFKDQDNASITDDYYRNDLFSILMYQKITRKLPFLCGKRGYYTVKSFDVVSNNLFANQKFAVNIKNNEFIYVYPKLVSIEELDIQFKKQMGDIISKRRLMEDPFEFRGIREYQPYDAMKTVNFKASARTGELMVNVFDYTFSQEVIVFLNVQKEKEWVDELFFERSISIAATLCSQYIDKGFHVKFVSNARDVFYNEEIVVEFGAGNNHTNTILNSMARINLKKDAEPIAHKLKNIYDDSVILLVSMYCESDLQEAYYHLSQRGNACMWILPCRLAVDHEKIKDIACENVIPWEVCP